MCGKMQLVKKMTDEISGDLANEISYQKFSGNYMACRLHVYIFQNSCGVFLADFNC